MNSKYKVLKYSSNKFENIDDLISIEEPLEISLKFKESDKWINQSLSITMRTPGDDEAVSYTHLTLPTTYAG